jgi:hypothetical protein
MGTKIIGIDSIEPIHEWFELSYASYLVLPRSILQSAPISWQKRFVKCLNELEELFGNVPLKGTYKVYLKDKSTGRFLSDPLMNYERGRRQIPYKEIPNKENDGHYN